MGYFLVTFDRPVRYLPDHFNERLVTDVPVAGATTPVQALAHALRVTSGPGEVVQIAQVEKFLGPPPVLEAPNDPPLIILNAIEGQELGDLR